VSDSDAALSAESGLKVVGLRYESEGFRLGPVDFQLREGEVLAVFGPNGAGKSTLLRILAGLEPAAAGRIWLNGADITGVPSHLRQIGMVFQDLALFPQLTVWENLAYGPRAHRWSEAEVSTRVEELLRDFQLIALADRRPSTLSGGEQQRVALARALAPHPRLLLFDEPLSSADREIRWELQHEIRERVRTDGIPALYVTHDLDEGAALATRMAFLRGGRWLLEDRADDLRRNPRSRFVAEFLGFNVRRTVDGWMASEPTHADVVPEGTAGSVPGIVRDIRPDGDLVHLTLSLLQSTPGVRSVVHVLHWGPPRTIAVGARVGIHFRDEIPLFEE
jgi:thiamine transport system ATP-binding protein